MDPRWEPSAGGGARSRWASQPRRSLAGQGALGRRQPERRGGGGSAAAPGVRETLGDSGWQAR